MAETKRPKDDAAKKRRDEDAPTGKEEMFNLRSGGRRKFSVKELPRRTKVLGITAAAAAVLVALAMMAHDNGVLAISIILATFVIAAPQFLLIYERFREVKEMEEKFPVFLRDVIETLRSGMPLHTAITTASNFDYGKLSPEVKRMANHLSWGMPLGRVLDQFSTRVKGSKRILSSVKIIQESYNSGGDVASTLEAVSDNVTMLEEAQKERSAVLSQYVLLMYAISLIFIGIVVSINNLMMPIFKIAASTASAGGIIGISNPCNTCFAATCAICGFYEGTASLVFSVDPTGISAYYISLFFYMSLIQSVCSGLVAGQINDNSVRAGIKHSMILFAITFGTFLFLVRVGLLG